MSNFHSAYNKLGSNCVCQHIFLHCFREGLLDCSGEMRDVLVSIFLSTATWMFSF